MKLVCPVCEASYRVSVERLSKPITRATCKRCGSSLSIDRDTGEVVAETASQSTTAESVDTSGSQEGSTPSLNFANSENKDSKDYLAIGVLVAVMAVLAVLGVYLVRTTEQGSVNSPFETVFRWFEDSGWTGKDRDATTDREKSLGKNKSSKAKGYYSRGYELYRKKRYHKALPAFDSAIETNQNYYQAYFWRGRTYLKMKHYPPALADFERVVELNPSYTPAYDNLGWLHGKMEEYDKSIHYLTKSIDLRPENGWAYYYRGSVYYRKGDLKKAIEDAEKSCNLGYDMGCEVYENYKDQVN
jgi:tetratricopeptide (TPR) repeat protein